MPGGSTEASPAKAGFSASLPPRPIGLAFDADDHHNHGVTHRPSTPPPSSAARGGAGAGGQASAPAESQAGTQGGYQSATSDSSTAGNESSRSGSSLDTMLGKLIVDRGLVTRDELDECTIELRARTAAGEPRTIEDVLVDREFLTRRQVHRLKSDLETDRSSRHIPGYKVIKKLGAGAMATVYLGKQLSLDRFVAVKVLPKKFSSDPKFIERFYKEGRAAARLNDQNIVQAYDVGQAGEHHYFVMEYVDGETVYDRIAAKKRFSEKEALQIIRQVASALKHAHEQGFIHRDIKPKNIMLSKNGAVKLADLGLARAMSDKEAAEAESGRAFGTPYYISPEQIRGEKDIGPPSDIYGLGATFFHMVTGRVPFEGKSPSEVMHRHLKIQLTPPDHLNPELSSDCAQIIEMMLAKHPRERYQSARDLITDLDLVMRGERPEHARPHVDISQVAKSAAESTAGGLQRRPSALATASQSPLTMIFAVLLALSVIANVVLIGLYISS
jgi:eukaryotic-like serine/threonine-protein kinase